ncbi:YihY family inner membrane protein [Hydrogenophaga sp. OTU3427]|uniref:YihY family inner membrane protein n=1 Tax=Hydrogenophaga sp. OTU3427 TaxID=3043856 RepID=UPI00313C67B2
MTIDEAMRSLRAFPWRVTGRTLLQRFREDRLGNTASSLTFTTLISLVPLFTVMLAVFSAFPMFAKLQGSLQQWLAASLIPDPIAKQVIGALTQFASKANRLGLLGFAVLLITAISLVLTIDRTFNAIWRVRRARPLAQRVLVYWALLTLGPLLLAGSLSLTSYVISVSKGLVDAMPQFLKTLLDLIDFALSSAGIAALYRYVPNTAVQWRHAMAGGLFAALGLELARSGMVTYIGMVPAYASIYGAFSAVPILLLWVYLMWLVLLLGAVIAAYLPSLLDGVARRGNTPGWRFQLAVEVLQHLHEALPQAPHALDGVSLSRRMRVDGLQLEPVFEALLELGWIGRLEDGSYVLLAPPDDTTLAPLMRRLLLAPAPGTGFVWTQGLLPGMHLRDVLGGAEATH